MSELTIDKDRVVTLAYKVYNDQQQLVDSADKNTPFQYLHGHANIVPGLESQLQGLSVGYKGNLVVPNAYGEIIPELIQEVDKSLFTGLPEGVELEVGLNFLAATANGDVPVRIVKIKDDRVTVDANLDLAGQTLTFEVEVLGVRNATIDELALGLTVNNEKEFDAKHARQKM